MRSYDPWDACVTMAKSWGNLKWVTAAFMRDRWAQGICVPVQFSPRTWRGQGAGKSARASWLLSWRGPKAGERKGGTRDRERLSGAVCVCLNVYVCMSAGHGGWAGGQPQQRLLVPRPRTGLFSSQAINVIAASKAG